MERSSSILTFEMHFDHVDKGEDSSGIEEKSDLESFKERSRTMLQWLLKLLALKTLESEVLQTEWGRIVRRSTDAVGTAIGLEKETPVLQRRAVGSEIGSEEKLEV
ncbi:hypothetical protein NPIL_194221 [Nephila pilipes]|uniref:Uncharacterized protein n=1 Tax=Nephila pilipes TaxID=299642 RepID=A0A8X6QNC6_NEPPI|nr:hypothetical protein NPIL_630291 [Nephila pilipes]GFU23736.1 hypothetical protein NPIL_194221 [Nephila pilipes]